MTSDAETTTAEALWALVHAVQKTIGKDGRPLIVAGDTGRAAPLLAKLRKLADQCDPQSGKY